MAFQRFMTAFSTICQGVIAIDGKVLRRSFDRASGKSALHMVSAWGCEQRGVLAPITICYAKLSRLRSENRPATRGMAGGLPISAANLSCTIQRLPGTGR
jgi:hypothetical protein